MLRRRLDATYRPGEFPGAGRVQGARRDRLRRYRRAVRCATVGRRDARRHGFVDVRRAGRLRRRARSHSCVGDAGVRDGIPGADHAQDPCARCWPTYLGSDAAERVLAGNVVRGRAERLHAVVWFADLVGLHAHRRHARRRVRARDAERVRRGAGRGDRGARRPCAQVHRRRLARDLSRRGGVVGLRARARCRDRVPPPHRASSTRDARREGLPISDAHIALHVGEVLYGNVGSPRRLDFTVLGSAVNEAARIEALCGSLDQPVIVSSAFAQAAGEAQVAPGEPRPLRDEGRARSRRRCSRSIRGLSVRDAAHAGHLDDRQELAPRARVLRNAPTMRLVTIDTPGLCTPRVVMHWCAASTTTATPRGFSTS